ncbi:MAG: bifunctional (p)ppGpp synthetase/guanosine-3',5'-bis(diphosphate) 3'-pyrophosphohydrolase, partial [Bacilli bacterium]|nr:bifunctional (p)ppGpp synthetase/guanosine-3',5'-bis(diphosphate) 3'-pyrophosphohydrolase [Bacilli bacterium]
RGKDLFQKEIRRRKLAINDVTSKIDNIIKELKVPDENELYIGIGTGKFSSVLAVDLAFKTEELSKEEFLLEKIVKTKENIIDVKNDILVDGIDEIKVTLASCCNPIKGDKIVGYISRGNGIIVHNENCHNIASLEDRLISVKWNDNIVKKFKTNLNIYSSKKDNILLDIISKTSGENITITKVNTISKSDYNLYELTIEVFDLESLNKYILILRQDTDIIKVERSFN